MTKADIVSEIAKSTGVEKVQVQAIVEAFMESIKTSLTQKNNVYLRGFGSFIVKKRAKKVARNISKNTTITIPEHNIPGRRAPRSAGRFRHPFFPLEFAATSQQNAASVLISAIPRPVSRSATHDR